MKKFVIRLLLFFLVNINCIAQWDSQNSNTTVVYKLTVDSVNPSMGITISNSPADNNTLIAGTTSYTLNFNSGTTVILTAPTTYGSNTFFSWTGCTSTSANVCTIVIKGNTTILANYLSPGQPPPTINITSSGCLITSIDGTPINKATLTITGVNSTGIAIPFTIPGQFSTIINIQRQISNGAIVGTLVVPNPEITNPASVGYTFNILDGNTLQHTIYSSVAITPDNNDNFNLCSLSPAISNSALPVVYSTAIPSFNTLVDSATVTLNVNSAAFTNSELTLNSTLSNRMLNLAGLVNGSSGLIILKHDSIGGASLTLGTGCTWYLSTANGFIPSTSPIITAQANGINLLYFIYDGNRCWGSVKSALNPIT